MVTTFYVEVGGKLYHHESLQKKLVLWPATWQFMKSCFSSANQEWRCLVAKLFFEEIMAQHYFLVCYNAFKMGADFCKSHSISEIALKFLSQASDFFMLVTFTI